MTMTNDVQVQKQVQKNRDHAARIEALPAGTRVRLKHHGALDSAIINSTATIVGAHTDGFRVRVTVELAVVPAYLEPTT